MYYAFCLWENDMWTTSPDKLWTWKWLLLCPPRKWEVMETACAVGWPGDHSTTTPCVETIVPMPSEVVQYLRVSVCSVRWYVWEEEHCMCAPISQAEGRKACVEAWACSATGDSLCVCVWQACNLTGRKHLPVKHRLSLMCACLCNVRAMEISGEGRKEWASKCQPATLTVALYMLWRAVMELPLASIVGRLKGQALFMTTLVTCDLWQPLLCVTCCVPLPHCLPCDPSPIPKPHYPTLFDVWRHGDILTDLMMIPRQEKDIWGSHGHYTSLRWALIPWVWWAVCGPCPRAYMWAIRWHYITQLTGRAYTPFMVFSDIMTLLSIRCYSWQSWDRGRQWAMCVLWEVSRAT